MLFGKTRHETNKKPGGIDRRFQVDRSWQEVEAASFLGLGGAMVLKVSPFQTWSAARRAFAFPALLELEIHQEEHQGVLKEERAPVREHRHLTCQRWGQMETRG